MGYDGTFFPIRYGSGGLHTDDPQGLIPPHKLTRAINITLENGRLRKEGGSRQWNASALPAGVKRFIEYWPDENNQRVIVVCKNGKIYRFKDAYNYAEVKAEEGSTVVLDVSWHCTMVVGGEEEAGDAKKLFIFTGNNPVQVISGDGTTRADIANGATDWSGRNHPFFGIIHGNRLHAFGNRNNPHRDYISLDTNHEDFTGTPLTQQVEPGVSERLMTAMVYKKRLFYGKYPLGVFMLNDTDATIANWTVLRTHKSFGFASPQSVVDVLDDIAVANNYGGITSVAAAERTDDIKTADIFSRARVQKFLNSEISKTGLLERDMIYNPDNRNVYVIYRSKGNYVTDRICRIDFNRQEPIITWSDKDQANCFGSIQDVNRVGEIAYGSDDGYIYLMDKKDFNVGGNAYNGLFWTPYMDFGTSDLGLSEKVKSFEHLEVIYEPTGTFDLSVDVYIDLIYSQTVVFELSSNSEYGAAAYNDDREGMYSPEAPLSKRVEIGGEGRRISLRCNNASNGESFIINGFNIYYKPTAEQQLEM